MLRDDQQYIIGQISGLASLACFAALQANSSTYEALQKLGACRGIITGVVIDSRSDVTALETLHPELHNSYNSLRELIASHHYGEIPLPQTNGHLTLEKLLENLETTEWQIRKLPGFASFQLPAPLESIQLLANSGPIVTFNVCGQE